MAKDISANIELKGGTLETNADIHGLIPVKGNAVQSDWNEDNPSSDAYIKNKPDIDEKIMAILPTDTASGAVAYFPDGADGVPLKSLVIDIKPVQDTSSGVLSPDNVCPISGWTGMELTHIGKNLFDRSLTHATNSNIWLGTSATNLLADGSFMLPADSYTFSVSDVQTGIYVANADKNIAVAYGKDKVTFTLSELTPIKLMLYKSGKNSSYWDTITIQLEHGTTATEYEPYKATTLPISWEAEAGTVYGGKLDVRSGKLTVYPYYASYNGETLTGEWISDRDVYAEGATPTIGAQVVNIGAEGTEIQLEPHEVRSLLGTNNILADTGDTSVEYKANIQLYIQKKIAE